MIESAIIDGYGHNNDTEGLIEEMQEFDRTLRQLVAYINEHPNTLLVVTADHETGGTGVNYTGYEAKTYGWDIISTKNFYKLIISTATTNA